ncbi:MAG: hypothetical protein KAU36_08550 [candidate division Zixibacteria bacterium]|nr:hypothetical protein [candidate division Zixibacteria bacterium]
MKALQSAFEDFARLRRTNIALIDTVEPARPAFGTLRKLLESSIDMTANEIERLADLAYLEPVTVTSAKIRHSSAGAMQFLPIHEAYTWA